jgi:CRP-like cAMP-binding protein
VIHPITTLGEGAVLDGAPRAVDVEAMSDGEVMRLGYDGFEALAARNPLLARQILFDIGRILSARLRAGDDLTPGWTG